VDTDRNLLFAVLALQADLLDRDQFIRACTLWAGRKDTPIANLLVELGWLTPADRADVERLLDRKLKRHGGDARAGLAEAAAPDLRAILAGLGDPDVDRSVAALHDTPTGPGREAAAREEGSSALAAPRAGRNLLYEEIGRGGMGLVLRGRDPGLGRDLAVKVLREEYRDNTGVARRFVEEAQVGGQLQHPGVVPVYELGQFDDGRPFFTMKLVKGRTLADLLKGRASPQEDLPRFLGIFEQLCQTLAYAHSKGVIHRDLKPSNVMVGAFGEVQVMDWGLAKVLQAPRGADPESTLGTVIGTVRSRATADEDGRTGVVGTPAYMAPEQARGPDAAVDERADVFGLGACLCVLLTGEPPFTGATVEEVMGKAVTADLAETLARLDGCGADEAVVGLCRACLAAEPAEWPRDAGEVAARVAAYRAGVQERLRRAELERAAAEVRAVEERKRRRLAVALAAAVLLLVVALGGGSWWWQHQQTMREAEALRRRQEADGAVRAALGEGRLWLALAREQPLGDGSQLREAQAAARKALELAQSRDSSEDLRQEAQTLRRELESEAAALARDRRLLIRLAQAGSTPEDGPLGAVESPGLAYRQAFHEYGLDLDSLPAEAVVKRLRARPAPVRAEVTAALDEWAVARSGPFSNDPAEPLWQLASAIDPNPDGVRKQLRAIARRGRLKSELRLGALSHRLLPLAALAGLVPGENRNRLRHIARTVDPGRTPTLTLRLLTTLLEEAGDEELAKALLRAARRSRPADVHIALRLAYLLNFTWGLPTLRGFIPAPEQARAEAFACFEAARAVRPELAVGSARVLMELGRKEEAEGLLRDVLRRDPGNDGAWFWLWLWLEAQGRLVEAREAFHRYARFVGPKLGDLRSFLLHKTMAIWWSRIDGTPLNRLSGKQIAARHRRELELLPDNAFAYNQVGKDLVKAEQYAEAEVVFQNGIRADPQNPYGYVQLGEFLLAQSRFREAEELIRKAIASRPATFKGRATRTKRVPLSQRMPLSHAAAAYGILSLALQRQAKPDEAIDADRRAVAIAPWDPTRYFALGDTLSAGGRFSGAVAAYRHGLRLNQDYPRIHLSIALILHRLGRLDDAVAECRRAIQLKPALASAHGVFGLMLIMQGKWAESVAASREAIRLAPSKATYRMNLGTGLWQQGRLTEALTAYQKALRLAPGNQNFRSKVRNLEGVVALLPRLEAVRRGKAKPDGARECFQLAWVAQLRHFWLTAVRLYEQGLEDDPASANNLDAQHRYNAACVAARVGCGSGEEGVSVGARERARRRRQALAWLRADLALWAGRLDGAKPAERRVVRAALRRWRADPNLAGLRDPGQVTHLPTDEQAACRQLWAEVGALVEKARYQIAGALEGEKLKVLGHSGSFETSPMDMTGFSTGDWSGDRQLGVRSSRTGEWLDLALPVPADGKYQVVVFLTRSKDSGIVQFSIDGRAPGKPIDCFNASQVVSTGPIDLGVVKLKKGTATLRGAVVGTNAKSVGLRYSWGLDCLVLKAAGP
jgi:serine/threonine-protein kinase